MSYEESHQNQIDEYLVHNHVRPSESVHDVLVQAWCWALEPIPNLNADVVAACSRQNPGVKEVSYH